MNPNYTPGQSPAPVAVVVPGVATPSDAAIIGGMVQNLMSTVGDVEKSRTEQERLKTTAEMETARLGFRLGVATLICGMATIGLFAALGVYAFSGGEKALLGQVVSGGFGFLAGIGISRFMPKSV